MTADILSRGRQWIEVHDSLIELDMGEWEGLTFSEIRQRFPDLYEQRGKAPERFTPPNGETLAAGQQRIVTAMRHIMLQEHGDIAVVAHSGINRLLICAYNEIPLKDWMTVPQPYGCINILRIDEERLTVEETGRMPRNVPDEAECYAILIKRQTPQQVIEHCKAVTVKAQEIAAGLINRGILVDRKLIFAGSLLHDIARVKPHHARIGADWLIAEGYPLVAKVIGEHEQLPEIVSIDESAVVYLADKLILETQEVALEERFARSLEKCRDETARLAHEKRFKQALWLREKICAQGEHNEQ
jgi:putative nucleotidyltransferase with HDIG domain